jgi:flagellar protein FlaG
MIDTNASVSDIRSKEVQSASVDPRPQTSLNSAAETNGAAPTANESQLSLEKTRSMVAELNKTLEEVEGNYSVSVDNDTGLVVVRITDTETGDIIKQVPPEQVLEAGVSLDKIIGLLVNDQA